MTRPTPIRSTTIAQARDHAAIDAKHNPHRSHYIITDGKERRYVTYEKICGM